MRLFSRNKADPSPSPPSSDPADPDVFKSEAISQPEARHATRARSVWSWLTALFLFIAVIFLIMVEIGNTSNRSVLRDIYFIKLDLTNVIPETVPNAVLINSIAQSIGLHDFYQVGLWNYCQGYNAQGVTNCSETRTLYWFNPVAIIASELIAGASIRLPDDINSILGIIEVASHWMFGMFLAGACLSFVLIFVMPLAVFSRWISFLYTILTFFNALIVTAAAVIATVMFVIMRNVFQNNPDVNIRGQIGTTMFALMWVAAAFTIFAWLTQLSLMCCCVSRRDVRTGRKERKWRKRIGR